jgi:hypothetical protein
MPLPPVISADLLSRRMFHARRTFVNPGKVARMRAVLKSLIMALLKAAEPPRRLGATPYDDLVPGALDRDRRRIKWVIGRHRNLAVWVTEDHTVGWHYIELPARLRPAAVEFQRLVGLARSTLPKNYSPQIAVYLGTAMYGALLTGEGADPLSAFAVARSFVETKSRERAAKLPDPA